MKTLIALFIATVSFNSNANLVKSIQGFYLQKVQTHVKTKKGVSIRTNINVAEVIMIDENAERRLL